MAQTEVWAAQSYIKNNNNLITLKFALFNQQQ